MGYVPPIVDFIAKKIARIEGVELSCVTKDGGVDVILEGGYQRELRAHVLDIGMRSMVPVRVFYRMPDGRAIGEDAALDEFEVNGYVDEAIEDYYTRIRVAGFADDPAKAPPDEVAGDVYGNVSVKKDVEARDKAGQLKLCRIRGKTRGRPVVGWKYGDNTLRQGSKVKFKRDACLHWTLGRTMSVKAGSQATVHALASKQPLAYLSMGEYDQIELPVHAVGHVYDVMVDPKFESGALSESNGKARTIDNTLGYLAPEVKRLVMTIGFGRTPGQDDTPVNKPFTKRAPKPTAHGYQNINSANYSEAADKDETDALHDPVCDPRFASTAQRDPRRPDKKQKTVLLGKKQVESELTTKGRAALSSSDFVFPKTRKYPIQDLSHAKNALSRAGAYGTPDEKKRVYAAVRRRYPELAKRSETI